MTETWTAAEFRNYFKTGQQAGPAKPHRPVKKKKRQSNKAIVEMRLLFAIEGIEVEEEHKFHPLRKFRFDFVVKGRKIAIEYEGIMQGKSRHTTISGYSKDTEKYNLAALEGWTVLRYTKLTYGKLIEEIKQLLK